MLGKLLKYETKATARTFLLMYAVVIALAIVNRIFYALNMGSFTGSNISGYSYIGTILSGITTGMYILMVVALFVTVTIVVIMRFYKNMYGSEGYLSFTLPVKSWEHIASKMLVAALWSIVSTVVTIISLFILLSYKEIYDGFIIGMQELLNIMRLSGINFAPYVIEFVLLCIASLFGSFLPLYACISVGQLWKKHRVLGAFIAYLVYSTALQIITGLITGVSTYSFAVKMDTMIYSNDVMMRNEILNYISTIFIISIFISIVVYIASFFVTKYMMDKKLDLE